LVLGIAPGIGGFDIGCGSGTSCGVGGSGPVGGDRWLGLLVSFVRCFGLRTGIGRCLGFRVGLCIVGLGSLGIGCGLGRVIGFSFDLGRVAGNGFGRVPGNGFGRVAGSGVRGRCGQWFIGDRHGRLSVDIVLVRLLSG